MRRTFNTTTALIASLSLMLPAPGFAQEAQTEQPLLCPDGSQPPCVAPAEEAQPEPEATPQEAPAEPEPQPEAPAATQAAPEPEPEAAPEPAPAVTQEQATEPATEAAQEPEPEPEPEVTQEVAPEPAPETAQEPAQEPAPEAAPVTAEEPAPTTEASPDTTEPAPAAPEGEQTPPPVIPPATAPAETGAAPTEAPADTQTQTEAGTTTETQAPVLPLLPEQPAPETGAAPVAEALSAPETPAEATVVEETVTEDTARSSAEEFVNKLSATEATAPMRKRDSGLSDGEKAVLLGLGALAVGAMLNNNRRVEVNSGDRIVVTNPDGSYEVIKDDNALLRQPGSTVRTETFADGSTRTTVLREDGTRIVTLYDPELRIIRRVRLEPNGREYVLIDDSRGAEPIDVEILPRRGDAIHLSSSDDDAALRRALERESGVNRAFSLAQVRQLERVRALAPVIDVDAITFDTGSSAIRPEQARALSRLGRLVQDAIADNPREIFLVEGHTDAVGSAAYNLALSDRRAESVALALTEYFDVPPENLVVQGYGEEFLKIETEGAEQANRRVSLRRITDLLRVTAAN